mgnify:CR=1 FL=1|jgi:arylsulfatase A-like enzyme
MKKYNVIFIMADQMKASASNLYSEIGIETPNLKRLKNNGVIFDNAITPHPLCVPARTSVMASKYPHTTGCRRNETLMPEKENHVFKIWKKEGYKLGLIGKNHCFENNNDLELFDVLNEFTHSGRNGNRNSMQKGSFSITDSPIETYDSHIIAQETKSFLNDYKDDPFALWVSIPDPHEPYEVPRKFFDEVKDTFKFPKQRDDEFSDGTSPERNVVLNKILDFSNNENSQSDQYRKDMVTTYMGMTKFVDYSVGMILDEVEKLGLKDNTIIVFTADHGDFSGEHNMMCKGGVFYDSLTKVPLIMSGGPIDHKDLNIESPASLIDIMPTILNIQNIGIPNDYQGQILPIVPDGKARVAAFSEYGAGGKSYKLEDLELLPKPLGYHSLIDCLWAREAEGRRKMVRTKDWKFVHDPSGDKDELYNIANDPWEHYNLAEKKEYQNQLLEMKSHLLEWMIETEDPVPVALPDSIGRPKNIENDPWKHLDK